MINIPGLNALTNASFALICAILQIASLSINMSKSFPFSKTIKSVLV